MQKTYFLLLLCLNFALGSCLAQSKPLAVGDTVPEFVLTDQQGNRFDIKDYLGKEILVIYFYPKDESMVCTKEACAFRDDYSAFTKAGARVIGINGGTASSHEEFAINHNLPFTILSDPGNKVLRAFGVRNKLFFTGRETFVVNKKGKIAFTYDAFTQGAAHKDAALRIVNSLNQSEK